MRSFFTDQIASRKTDGANTDFFALLPFGLIERDLKSGEIKRINNFLVCLLDLVPSNLTGKSCDETALLLFPESIDEYSKLLRYQKIKEPYRVHLKARSNPEIWLDCFLTFTDETSIEVFCDVTSEVLAKRELQKKTEELETFSKILSHDIKGAIFTLRGFISLLNEETLEPQLLKIFSGIKRSEEKISRIVDSCMEFYKAINSKIELKPVSVPSLIRRELDFFESELMAVNGTCILESEDIKALLDEASFTIILRNLISNAIKFRSEDRKLVIKLRVFEVSKRVRVTVSDNGKGVKKDQLNSLFKPFSRCHSGIQGTGLGLNLVKKLVERMHGEISCEINDEGGLTFILEFLAKI
ncbi:MAG: HAMP domain-containing histidine kinase [Deltaproteobacteria bacterium]|nr:HAMP domain-containing histidine kinase [Deltaproteobacteria bacterium]